MGNPKKWVVKAEFLAELGITTETAASPSPSSSPSPSPSPSVGASSSAPEVVEVVDVDDAEAAAGSSTPSTPMEDAAEPNAAANPAPAAAAATPAPDALQSLAGAAPTAAASSAASSAVAVAVAVGLPKGPRLLSKEAQAKVDEYTPQLEEVVKSAEASVQGQFASECRHGLDDALSALTASISKAEGAPLTDADKIYGIPKVVMPLLGESRRRDE